jgi:hypothetical protein
MQSINKYLTVFFKYGKKVRVGNKSIRNGKAKKRDEKNLRRYREVTL